MLKEATLVRREKPIHENNWLQMLLAPRENARTLSEWRHCIELSYNYVEKAEIVYLSNYLVET